MSGDLSRRSAFGAKAERDHKLELALKHELRQTGKLGAEPALRRFSEGGCVDAETLGAWLDGGLDAVQMASVELHASTCARCQAIVGAAARSAPVLAPAVTQGWLRFPRWALAPIAAAAAITIWMVVPQDTMQAPAPVAEQRKQDAPLNDAAKQGAAPPAQESAAHSPSKDLAGTSAPSAPPRPEAFTEEKGQRANAAPPAVQDRDQGKQERTAALGAAAASAPLAAAPAEPTLQERATLAFAPIEIVSADTSRRWRISSGLIERSEDGGASWVATRTLSGQAITGGTAPTGSICWLIGSAGMVMLAADGVTFAEVPLPEPVDLTSITAADARTATVTTADGRRFRTEDSGRTWRQL